MGALVEDKEDWTLFIEWARASRALGYGVEPGRYLDTGALEEGYLSILEGLEWFEELSKLEQKSTMTVVFHFFSYLEFEVQSRCLLEHFSPSVLRGKNPIQFREIFLRYAGKHPERVAGGTERSSCIDRLVETNIIRREWYDHTMYSGN